MFPIFFKKKTNIVFLAMFFVSVILEISFRVSSDFSEFFCLYISQYLRYIYLPFSLLPFAFSESLIIVFILMSLVLFLLVIIKAFSIALEKEFKSHLRTICKWFLRVGIIVIFLFSTTFSSAYHRKPLEKLLDLETIEVTEEKLEYATVFALERLYEISEYIDYSHGHETTHELDFNALSHEVEQCVNTAASRYGFLHKSGIQAKPLAFSSPLTYTHISGIYTFFTGEPCININYPHYSVPYTMAHEYAHQRGIGHEDEAEFMAFLILLESRNPYLYYSAWMQSYVILSNALYKINPEKALSITAALPPVALNDFGVYARDYTKYIDSTVGKVAKSVNDTYLKANGVDEGIESYDSGVVLLVSFIHKHSNGGQS